MLNSQLDSLRKASKLDEALQLAKTALVATVKSKADTSIEFTHGFYTLAECYEDLNKRDSAHF